MFCNKCIFCKNYFQTNNPKRRFCYRNKCIINFDFLILAKKGYNPEMYYQNLIRHGAEESCHVCEQRFKPKSAWEFIIRICRSCKKEIAEEKKEKLVADILEDPRRFLDSLKEKK